MIIGGACAFAFLRGLLTGDTGRIDRPDEERIDYTSSEGMAAPGGRSSRAPYIAPLVAAPAEGVEREQSAVSPEHLLIWIKKR